MGNKESKANVLAKDLQSMTGSIRKLEAFLKTYNEIATGYQKYRKNGGASIPGLEKHLGVKEQAGAPSKKTKKPAKTAKAKVPKEAKAPKESVKITAVKKAKKKEKK